VLEALRAGLPADRLLLRRGSSGGVLERIRRAAAGRGLEVREEKSDRLDRLLRHTEHRGAALRITELPQTTLEDFLARRRKAPGGLDELFLLLLDGIQDPRNLGAAVRSAEAAGAHGVLLPDACTAPAGDAAFRASAGALAWQPLVRVSDPSAALDLLGECGVTRTGLEERLGRPLDEVSSPRPLVLVLGGEGRGISRRVLDRLDLLVRIPLAGRVGSLNASVAAGIVLFHFSRINAKKEP